MARQLLHLRLFLFSSPKPLLLLNLPSSHLLHQFASFDNPSSSPISRISTLTPPCADSTVASLAKEILSSSTNDSSPDLAPLLESDSARSIVLVSTNTYTDGSPFLELLSLLKRRPLLALQVFDWRRNLPESPPLIAEDYASAIALAGRAQNLSLAVKLFNESMPTTNDPILYNALMTAFMCNGEIKKTMSLFPKLMKETKCGPDTVSYNILLSLYSYHILDNQMEAVLRAMDSFGIPRSVETYKILIDGYLRSRRWEQMERAFDSLKEPDTSTRLLMLRGYAISGKLDKMESMYELVKGEVHTQERSLIWAMIYAYCKRGESSLRKIEELVKLVRKEEYFPYLHIVLIKVYAKEGLIDEMEKLIFYAFKRNIVISSHRVMRTILALYFKCGDVDRLDSFIKQAEKAGWSLSKDLYRCKMILYSRLGRLTEMCCVLDKMDSYWPIRDRYTLKILYKGFSYAGRMWEMNMVIGLMFKYGFRIPQGAVG